MPYHVPIWPRSTAQQVLRELYAFNLSNQQLQERFIDPYDTDRPITWGGRTLPAGDVNYLKVGYSDQDLDERAIAMPTANTTRSGS
jgi:hypothetical protein